VRDKSSVEKDLYKRYQEPLFLKKFGLEIAMRKRGRPKKSS